MQQAHHGLVGQIRLLGARAAATAAAGAAPAAAASAPPAALTLPNGRALEVQPSDISFHMPAEWAPHVGTWMAWPKRPDVWRAGAGPARKAFTDVILAISEFEPVTVIADPTVVRCGGGWAGGGLGQNEGAAAAAGARCRRRPAHPAAAPAPRPLLQPASDRSGPRRARRCRTACESWRCATTTRGCGTRGRRWGGKGGRVRRAWRSSRRSGCEALQRPPRAGHPGRMPMPAPRPYPWLPPLPARRSCWARSATARSRPSGAAAGGGLEAARAGATRPLPGPVSVVPGLTTPACRLAPFNHDPGRPWAWTGSSTAGATCMAATSRWGGAGKWGPAPFPF
jgi:hypothetical protein